MIKVFLLDLRKCVVHVTSRCGSCFRFYLGSNILLFSRLFLIFLYLNLNGKATLVSRQASILSSSAKNLCIKYFFLEFEIASDRLFTRWPYLLRLIR